MRMTAPIRQAIGHALKEARIKKNKTQKEVAHELGLSRQIINRYENGHDAPTGENLGKALKYFDIGIQLPGYGWRLTAEALLSPAPSAQPLAQQLTFDLNKPQEITNARVRILRKKDSIEIVIAEPSLVGA